MILYAAANVTPVGRFASFSLNRPAFRKVAAVGVFMRLRETGSGARKRRPRSLIGCWAQALGVPQDRLAAIVSEVVEERQAEPDRQRRLMAQPIE